MDISTFYTKFQLNIFFGNAPVFIIYMYKINYNNLIMSTLLHNIFWKHEPWNVYLYIV